MQLTFRWRDGTTIPAPSPFPGLSLRSHSWAAEGGPKRALLTGNPDLGMDYTKLLRCYVDVQDDEGIPRWWGMVKKIIMPHGNHSLVYSLDRLYNSIRVSYADVAEGVAAPTDRAITEAAEDPISIAEYGVFELLVSMRQATAAAAVNRRDILLGLYRSPALTPEEIQVDKVEIECCGIWDLLVSRYYANTGTDLVATTDQITAIVNAYDQFLLGTTIVDASGLSTSEWRDGDDTCMEVIRDLLNTGTDGGQLLSASVTRDQLLKISARPSPTSVEYYYTRDGELETKGGIPVPPEQCLVNVWAALKDLPPVLGGISSMATRYISEAEYNADTGKTTYRWNDIASAFKLLEVGR